MMKAIIQKITKCGECDFCKEMRDRKDEIIKKYCCDPDRKDIQFIEVSPDTIDPSCELQDIEVIKDFIRTNYGTAFHLAGYNSDDIDYVIVVKKRG